MRETTLDGTEWTCVSCGHRDYGEGFVPLDDGDEFARRRRAPSHKGSTL